jgi:uncharacterized lipoprotein YddW (UPF0748 family)
MRKMLAMMGFLTLFFHLNAQNPPKRELRGAWIAGVLNIDWPSSPTLLPEQQRAELMAILDHHQQTGMNAVFIQVRMQCDAFYPNSFDPWSEYFTGRQGTAPNPLYDPLQFAIEECRKRNLEFHAWINPFRAVINASSAQLAASHIATRQPTWLLSQGVLRILDPGLPQVRAYVTQVVMDIVRRYDIDGIHFDDYFYPYPPAAGTAPFNDSLTFLANNRGFTNIADWRRDNVNIFVKNMGDSIKSAKAWVKYGISPFGIWQNYNAVSQPAGSLTNGLQSYNSQYADSRKWIQQGWLDYIAPQIYWYSGHTAANYDVLVPWWNNVVSGRHLYIGHSSYNLYTSTDPNWRIPTQIPNQVRFNRTQSKVNGSIYYNTKSFLQNPLGFRDSLKNDLYKPKALLPTMSWIDSIAPPPPIGLTANVFNTQIDLSWSRPVTTADELEKARQYVIYRFETGATIHLNDARAIIAVIDSLHYIDVGAPSRRYTYIVTALDRLHNESIASNNAFAVISSNAEVLEAAPTSFLDVNVPNPFQGTTTLKYNLYKSGHVFLKIFDTTGREITSLVNQYQTEGEYSIDFVANNDLVSGIYYATLFFDNRRVTQKIVLNK